MGDDFEEQVRRDVTPHLVKYAPKQVDLNGEPIPVDVDYEATVRHKFTSPHFTLSVEQENIVDWKEYPRDILVGVVHDNMNARNSTRALSPDEVMEEARAIATEVQRAELYRRATR